MTPDAVPPTTAARRPKGSECECVTCSEFFGSPSAFDRHVAPVVCRPPAECRNKKTGEALFERTERKGGPTWVLAGERPNTWGAK